MTPELTQRIAVGIILIVVAALELWIGGGALWVFATIAALIMMREWGGLTQGGERTRLGQFALCIPLGIMSPLADGPGVLAFGLILSSALFLYLVSRNLWLSSGIIYTGIPILSLLWLRDLPDGLLIATWALSLVWATDTGAYFAGRAIGGPKVAPSISPNKTWAGVGGGTLSALALGWALMQYAGLPPVLALASPLLALLAQAGDFFESWMKRRVGVKDSGRLLPGHGGVLDRLDGVVTSLPVAALIVASGATL